jgi:hypothetical protein
MFKVVLAFTILSVSSNGGWFANNELERIWKKMAVAEYPGISMEGLKNITKHLS